MSDDQGFWSEYVGMDVKVVYRDGDNVRAYKGEFKAVSRTHVMVDSISYNKEDLIKVEPLD